MEWFEEKFVLLGELAIVAVFAVPCLLPFWY